MQSELFDAVVVWNGIIFDPNASAFSKYKQGFAVSSSPFKLYQPELSSQQKDKQIGQENEKKRMRGPYKRYTIHEKLQAVQCIKNGQDINRVSEKCHIPRKNLVRWMKSGCQRKEGGGRLTDKEMESMVMTKIKDGQLKDPDQIRAYAISLSKSEKFKASKSWFCNFSQRHNLKLPENQISQSPSNREIQQTGSIPN